MPQQETSTQAPSHSIPPTKPEPLTFERLSEEAQELDGFEIYVADSGYRVQLGSVGNLKRIARMEWITRLADCESCLDGQVEIDRGGYTSHSTNQSFEQSECGKCGGSGRRQIAVCVLVAE